MVSEYGEDIDRPYVINGSDLSILLKNLGVTAHGRHAAQFLEADGRPLADMYPFTGTRDDLHPGVTVAQLRAALTGFYAEIRDEDGRIYVGLLCNPDEAARELHERLTGAAGERENPDGLCEIAGDLSSDPVPYRLAEPVPLADDPEINAIRAVTGLLSGLGHAARRSVMRYLADRVEREDPF